MTITLGVNSSIKYILAYTYFHELGTTNYFKVRIFHKRHFRDFAIFCQIRKSLYLRNMGSIHENSHAHKKKCNSLTERLDLLQNTIYNEAANIFGHYHPHKRNLAR